MIFSLILLTLIWVLPINSASIYEQRPQSQLLKFIAALIVVLGHEIAFYCPSSPQQLRSETELGSLCVAFFLFMSGYGLLYGHLKKGRINLSLNWLSKKILKFIVPAITAMILYLIVKVYSGQTVDWIRVVKYWFNSNDNLLYGWYVSEIICLYIAFFICYHWVSRRYALIVLISIIVIAMLTMIILQMPIWYIQGLPCFIMGLFGARHDARKKITNKKTNSWHTQIAMTLLVMMYCIFKHFSVIQQIIPELNRWRFIYTTYFIIPPLFIIILTYILMRLPICYKMLNRGGYFYEVYLIQGATLLICRKLISEDWLFVLIGLITTIFVAKGMNIINNKILSFVQKRYCSSF